MVSLGLSVLELRAPELATFDNYADSFDYLRDNLTSLASPSERSLHRIPDLTLACVTHEEDEQKLKISDL